MPTVSIARLESELLTIYRRSRKGTFRKVRQLLAELRALPGLVKTSQIKADTIAAWLDAHDRQRNAATLLSQLKTLRTIFRYAESADYLRRDPFRWRRPQDWIKDALEEHEVIDRHISAVDAIRVCRQADAEALRGEWKHRRLRALIYVLAYTGIRKNEALGLKIADLDLAEGVFWIRPNERRKLKTPKSKRLLGLPSTVTRVLRPWCRETGCEWLFPGARRTGPWIDGAHGYRAIDEVRALGERAGVRGLTILSFRHTIGSVSEPAGLTELELQRLYGHTNTQTQRGYRKADLDNLRLIARKIDRGYKQSIIGVPREALTPKVPA